MQSFYLCAGDCQTQVDIKSEQGVELRKRELKCTVMPTVRALSLPEWAILPCSMYKIQIIGSEMHIEACCCCKWHQL